MKEINNDNFREEVTESQGHVLLDFWSPSCAPCIALMPDIEAMEADYPDVTFGKVDLSKSRRLAISQKVSRVPAILIYENGEVRDMLSGEEATADAVKELLDRL